MCLGLVPLSEVSTRGPGDFLLAKRGVRRNGPGIGSLSYRLSVPRGFWIQECSEDAEGGGCSGANRSRVARCLSE